MLRLIIIMRRAAQKIKPEQAIRIPVEFLKKLDRISLNELRDMELLSKRESLYPRNTLSPQPRKDAASLSVNSRPPHAYSSLRKDNEAAREKTSKIRFRTTGAGFRQRKHEPVQEEKTERRPNVFRKTPSRAKREASPKEHNNYEAFVFSQVVKQEPTHRERRIPSSLPPRIYFGEEFKFREKGEYEYNEELSAEDFEWKDEAASYQQVGFGVDINLSQFDLPSLEDPLGSEFIKKYLNAHGFCPVYKGSAYEWMQVTVIGFDPLSNRVIVQRGEASDPRKVSRLSIRFQSSLDFWSRINAAKRLSRQIKEEEKYIRYIVSRKQSFSMEQLANLRFGRIHDSIEKNWFVPYSRQFLVFKEMTLRPEKFSSMGIRPRFYQPFSQPPIVKSFLDYAANKEAVANRHFSRFEKFPLTLYKLFERLTEESCSCILTSVQIMSLEELRELECSSVRQVCSNISGKVREFLLSDILGELAFVFKSKQEERRYIKLHNFIFKDLITRYLYECNVQRWLSFLTSFLTWTKDTPEPIIKLALLVNRTARTVEIEPTRESVKRLLLEPLSHLESLVKGIPDILSELKGEPSTIDLKKSLLESSAAQINAVVEHSFQEIDLYCRNFLTKLRYLQRFKHEREPFTAQGRHSYAKYLDALLEDLKEVNRSVIFRSGIFSVDSTNLKQAMREAIIRYKNRLGKLVERQVEEEVEGMATRFKQREEELKRIPADEGELVRMRFYLNNDCQDFLGEANLHYELCQDFYQLFEDYCIELNFAQYEKATEAIIQQYKFLGVINAKLTQLASLEQQMIEAINNERDAILKGLEDMAPQIGLISNYSSLAQISECYVSTSRTYHDLENFQKQLDGINYRQKVLGQEISVFPVIGKLEKQLRPYFDLWNNAYGLVNLNSSLKSDPIHTLKYEELKQTISEYSRDLQRLSAYFVSAKNSSALSIIESLLEKVTFAEEHLWIVRSFTLEGVLKKEGIRKEIMGKIFGGKEVKFQELTLEMLIEEKVETCKTFVIENAEKAERIWKLELKIAAIVNEVKKLEFEFSRQLEVPFVEEKLLLALSSSVHEQLEIMEAIKDLEEAAYIQKKIQTIYSKIATIEETLLHMLQFQETFFPLLKLLRIEDLAGDMGKEMNTFGEVERIWKVMCLHFMKDHQIWEAIETDSHKNRLENLSKLMAQVDRKLTEVIDKKRQCFPRLFFIPHSKVRLLLLNQNAIVSSLYLPLLFSGVRDFVMRSDKIRGIQGWDGEEIVFKKSWPKTVIWEYLRFVEEEVGKVVQWEINFKSNKTQKYTFARTIRMLCEWTTLTEEALSNRDLGGLLGRLSKELEASKGSSLETCIFNSYLLMIRDQISGLINKNVGELSSFEWKKQLRFYITEGAGVEMKSLSHSLLFREEYTGNCMRPFVCLGDRMALQIVTLAWHMNTGTIIEQKATETITEVSGLTLRHFVEHQLDDNTQRGDILYLLRGYFCSDSWMSFHVTTPLAKELFEVIAQAAYEVHSVVEAGRSLFYLGGEPLNLLKSFRFNLFISLELEQSLSSAARFSPLEANRLQDVNTKFGVVFRAVNWMLPSEGLICRFKLESMNLSPSVIQQVMKLYEFLLLELKQEWFCESFSRIIDRVHLSVLSNRDSFFEMFIKHWSSNLSSQQIGELQTFLSVLKQEAPELQLSGILDDIESGRCSKKRILLIGEHLSGKDYRIRQFFRERNLQITQKLEYDERESDQWQYLPIHFFSKSIPLEQKLIIRAASTASLAPRDVDGFVVYYHRQLVEWRVLAAGQVLPKLNAEIRKEAMRQIQILLNLQIAGNSKGSLHLLENSFLLSFLKFLDIFCQTHRIVSISVFQRVQLVFMLLYWQAATFFPNLTLSPSSFGSTANRSPLNYYFDLEKSSWLEWTTLSTNHFCDNAPRVAHLFLPTKEAVSFIYFLSSLAAKTNIWIQSESAGIGLHQMIKRSISKDLLQFYKAHSGVSSSGISHLVSHNIAIFKKEGKYFPKQNQSLIICIEDINLPRNSQFDGFMSVLLNYSYEQEKKRLLAHSTFICTNSDAKGEDGLALAAAKTIVRLKASSPSEESHRTIFTYYLQWFFGNTENPFSKEVRSASQLIVELSIFILGECKASHNMVKLCHVVRVFEGLCECSPKTVKSTHDILHLWLYECRSVFDETFATGSIDLVQQSIQKFVSTEVAIEPNVMTAFKQVLSSKGEIFLKLPSPKLEYSQTYRKIDANCLYNHLTEAIQSLDFKLFSYFPLVVFESLLQSIAKLIRIFNIPQRHVLIYGAKQAGKCTLTRLASLIYCSNDADVISNIEGWKLNLGRSLSSIRSRSVPQCLTFRLREHEQEEFMKIIEQLLCLQHPQSLLFDPEARFLQCLGISSVSSQQYSSFKQKISNLLHCCIDYPSSSLATISSRFPYLFRKVEFINVHSNYLKGGTLEIAQASIGRFYSNFGLLAEINKILKAEGIELNQCKYIKLIQIAIFHYEKCRRYVEREEEKTNRAIQKVRKTEKQREELEKELQKTMGLLDKLVIKVEALRMDYKSFEEQYQDKVKDYNEHHEECEIERGKTEGIRKEVDFELSKVLPMLTAAEEAMAKVTRDDINQLRSFPSPPLPAAKVVESLIFLFNQSNLVKEKVLDGGQKVRDFWQYAKKFILNDRLLKRVSDFKPDTIKNLDKGVVLTLKEIIKKPQFLEERVFKASIAAGNLSLWIRAILAVYDVMTVIEPKKKLLNEAEEALAIRVFHLKNEREELNKFHAVLLEKKKLYEAKLEEKEKVVQRIQELQHFIANGKEILELLYVREREWTHLRDKQLKEILEKSQEESILTAVYFSYLAILSGKQRASILSKLESKFSFKHIFRLKKYRFVSLEEYQEKLFSLADQQSDNFVPFADNFYESLIWIHELVRINEKIIFVLDKSHLLLGYLIHESTTSLYGYHPKVIDCLKAKDFEMLIDDRVKNYDQDESDHEGEAIKQPDSLKEMLILVNLEHRPEFLRRMGEVVIKNGSFQILVVANESTEDLRKMMESEGYSFACAIEDSNEIKSQFLKQTFDMPIEELQQLSRSIAETRLKDKLIELFCSVDNIITSEDEHEEWIALNKEEGELQRLTRTVKKASKMQEERIAEAINIFEQKRTINISKMIHFVREYLNQSQEGTEKTIWNCIDWLKTRLSTWPQSLIKVVTCNYETTNALGFYLLKFNNKMEELQKSRPKEPTKPKQENKILSLPCEVVNPASLFHALSKNLNAFICLTDKYRLKKALDECKDIEERYKTEYLQQFLERQEHSLIYLISECGAFQTEELLELRAEELKDVLNHVEWNGSGIFKTEYQVERLQRKYESISPKESEYIRSKLYNRTLLRFTSEEEIMANLLNYKEKLQVDSKVIVGVKSCEKQTANFTFGQKSFSFVLAQRGVELQFWQFCSQLMQQYANSI